MIKVSVLMPAYNVEKYIGEAIESILSQTYRDFEFLIFNDGSKDNTAAIIESYKDERIKFFNYKHNKGLVPNLNYGISIAKGKYIVRMDADDISHPERLQKQVAFMEENTDVGVCGTWYDIIGDSKKIIKIDTNHDDLKIGLLFNSVFGHPSVIIRTSIIRTNNLFYDDAFKHAEDFKLWVELSRVSKLANLNEVLLHYRHHEGQVSNLSKEHQLSKAQAIRELQVEYILGNKLTDEERQMVDLVFGCPESKLDGKFFKNSLDWVYKLIQINIQKKIYLPHKLELILSTRMKRLMLNSNYDWSLMFSKSKYLIVNQLSKKDSFKFYMKCLLCWNTNQKSVFISQ